jgi:hypothetical protein
MKYYTINEIIEFSKEKNIEDWIHIFLNSSGDNIPMSKGLKKAKKYWIGPLEIDLNLLKRCCGYEENMEFVESKENFVNNINRLTKLIKNGYELAPLIIEYKENLLYVRDGTHRLEALKNSNYKKYWVVIWCNSETDYKKLFQKISK